jgi:magnesium chelatase subunit H
MKPKPTSAAERAGPRFVIVTLDNHLAGAVDRARRTLARDIPGLDLAFHAAADWNDPAALKSCLDSIAKADIIVATMLFMEEHAEAVLPAIRARRDSCDAVLGCMSAPEIVKLTRLGRFNMDGTKRGALDFLKRLRGSSKASDTGGEKQLAMLRRIPKILRFIPGAAQDVRAYFLTLQYWLAGSDENVVNLVRFLLNRYAGGAHAGLRGALKAPLPIEYPEVGVYHPRAPHRFGATIDALPRQLATETAGTVGLLLMRSYLLANNTAHYDAVIAALEARGLRVIPAFASGLDARPAVEAFFKRDGVSTIDAFVSLTGFSLVGGPAYNDSVGAAELLGDLDVPYIAAHALEFQTVEQWEASDRGLSPVEATMMVAIPELDGASAPTVFGGRRESAPQGSERDLRPHPERVERLAERVARLVRLRRSERAKRKVAIVLFNFPPNGGATGTAAFLGVYESLFNTLKAMKASGYSVEPPASVDALRGSILRGNAERFGTAANVVARISNDDHVRREPHLAEIEAQWGPAPGRHQTDGASIFVLGARFGEVLVGVQPAMGYEGDPMRLLFERGFAPTHAFSAFYRYLREDFGADVVLHFGMHGSLEFMPGKQVGMSASCWPERLIGPLPNVYLYAANNPSEGALAKRRSAATLVSYLTPSLAQAGLYRGLTDLKASVERYRATDLETSEERGRLAELIQAQAAVVDLAPAEPAWGPAAVDEIARLGSAILELEYALIPHGLHVVGQPPAAGERAETLAALAEGTMSLTGNLAGLTAITEGASVDVAMAAFGAPATPEAREAFVELARLDRLLAEDHETSALLRALDGRFVAPVAGGDLLRNPAILPTGRNLHGFDPYRIPSAFALADGGRQAEMVLARYAADGHPFPECVAIVLWGTDNLKSEGGPIGQALALIGARPRFDAYGRLTGASLIPLETLGRPRVDIVVTVSGIFRDLLPLQVRLLAEACFLAASADEPDAMNFVRKHAIKRCAETGCDLETAALRVFSNAEGAYGANVGMLIDAGAWTDEDEISQTFARRKCFAYGRKGQSAPQPELLQSVLGTVDFAYQNLDSVELGVTSIDHYFDSLGGMGRAAARARGGRVAPIYISDQTRGDGKVRSLGAQVALETRTRVLNPKWYEGMLKHGYEGVRQIEAHVTNTMGWSATTGQVDPWVYEKITQTFVLDPEMRRRLSELNPEASSKLANRVLEAHERGYWTPDPEMLAELMEAGDEFEDRLEGVSPGMAA